MIKSGVSHESFFQIMLLTIGFSDKENLEKLKLSEDDLTVTSTTRWANQWRTENDRFAKEAEYITGLLADERKKLDNQFRHLCKTIDSLAYVFGKEPYQTLANNINQLVANAQQSFKQKTSARKTRKLKEENESAL